MGESRILKGEEGNHQRKLDGRKLRDDWNRTYIIGQTVKVTTDEGEFLTETTSPAFMNKVTPHACIRTLAGMFRIDQIEVI